MAQPQVGSRFQLKVQVLDNYRRPIDFSAATVVEFRVEDPLGNLTSNLGTKTNGGSDGRLDVYLTPDLEGRWRFQVAWITGGISSLSAVAEFGVLGNL